MPFCSITLTAQKPTKLPTILNTIADHIKKRRLELGLLQRQVARMIGVDESTVTNWEKNRTTPTLHCIPMILEFLGYSPNTNSAATLGQKIMRFRKDQGVSQEKMARQLGVDPATLGRWERDESRPAGKLAKRVEDLVKVLVSR